MTEALQSSEAGTIRRVQTPEGVTFAPIPQVEPAGQAYVETQKAKTRRDLEMEAGRARVAHNAELVKNRPPRVISEKEARSQGTSTPVFRPNMKGLDRTQSGLGPLLRKVGSNVSQVPTG